MREGHATHSPKKLRGRSLAAAISRRRTNVRRAQAIWNALGSPSHLSLLLTVDAPAGTSLAGCWLFRRRSVACRLSLSSNAHRRLATPRKPSLVGLFFVRCRQPSWSSRPTTIYGVQRSHPESPSCWWRDRDGMLGSLFSGFQNSSMAYGNHHAVFPMRSRAMGDRSPASCMSLDLTPQ